MVAYLLNTYQWMKSEDKSQILDSGCGQQITPPVYIIYVYTYVNVVVTYRIAVMNRKFGLSFSPRYFWHSSLLLLSISASPF